jgi:hypothetical protein
MNTEKDLPNQPLTQDVSSHVDHRRTPPRPFAPTSVPNYGGRHYVDLHRDNSRGSQTATERAPESGEKN